MDRIIALRHLVVPRRAIAPGGSGSPKRSRAGFSCAAQGMATRISASASVRTSAVIADSPCLNPTLVKRDHDRVRLPDLLPVVRALLSRLIAPPRFGEG